MAQEEIGDIQEAQDEAPYPVQYSVDYPESRNRLTALVRIFLAIPILFVLVAIQGTWSSSSTEDSTTIAATAAGLLFLAPLLMILFRQKYPRWWFDWNLAFMKFDARVNAYLSLMRDEYPSTDEEQAVHLEVPYPDVERDLNRWLPLIKWFLAIPHFIVLLFLLIAALIVVVIAWFAILFTGRYPRDFFNFVEGTQRWAVRVVAYALLLVTDRYPPFRLNP